MALRWVSSRIGIAMHNVVVGEEPFELHAICLRTGSFLISEIFKENYMYMCNSYREHCMASVYWCHYGIFNFHGGLG